MKVNSKIYKGIEYVQISELPPDQQEKITMTINKELFIKILIDKKIVGNCLSYKDYERWYVNSYQVAVTETIQHTAENPAVQIALGKI